ncbi:MAG: homoserine dehydrogenase ThrA [Deltaproteobacteria bacterium]|nr:homoserine dehydrogenase ThrA [Deltaproteobacteria bacterium]
MKKINVGIVGFGTVGTGTAKILIENSLLIEERVGIPIVVKKIADHDIERKREINVDPAILTKDANEILNDPEIDIVVELIGGYGFAREFILKAIDNGKHVVTANKALLAVHGDEIFRAAYRKGIDIGFEASVGGGIPIIRALKEGLVANRIESIYGIVNGTTNYILTKMTAEGKKFGDVLKRAQEKGYAEADPTFDVEGVDAAHKLAVLISLAYGVRIRFEDIYTEGISKITPLDIEFAREFGYRIKLLAITKDDKGKIEARVHPTMLKESAMLANVDGVFNAIYVTGDAVGSTMFYGRGAGMMPTGSAVVSDIADIARNIIKKSHQRVPPLGCSEGCIKDAKVKDISETVNHYYIRFSAMDKPGVLSKISGILGENNISISSMIQKGRQVGGSVPIVMMTHEAKEKDVRKALDEIDSLPVVHDKTVFIRIEEGLS